MPSARIVSGSVAGPILEIVNHSDDAELWMLRGEDNDMIVFDPSPLEYVEVKCDRCGRWTRHIMRDGDGWQCIARRGCDDA